MKTSTLSSPYSTIGTRVNLKHQTGWISKTMIPGPVVPKPLVILVRSGEPYPTSFHLQWLQKEGSLALQDPMWFSYQQSVFCYFQVEKKGINSTEKTGRCFGGSTDEQLQNMIWFHPITQGLSCKHHLFSYSFSCFPGFFTNQFSNFTGFFGVRRVWLLNL